MLDDSVATGYPDMTVASSELEEALRRALACATFDLGSVDPDYPRGNVTIFSGRPEDILDPEGLRELYERERTQYGSRTRARPSVRVEDGPRSALVEVLRSLLSDFVDPSTGSVGHAFPMGGDRGGAVTFHEDSLRIEAQYSSVERLADPLVRCAAVTGCDEVAHLISDWVGGAPMRYSACLVLPVTLVRSFSPIPGVEFVPLGLTTSELPGVLPVLRESSPADYLGQTLVFIAAETKPALFRPDSPNPPSGLLHASLAPPVTLESIRQALSLQCDVFVDGGLVWDDYGHFSALADPLPGGRGSLGHLRHLKSSSKSLMTDEASIELRDEGTLDVPAEDLGALLGQLQAADARTRVAVSRWKLAKNPHRGLADRFIDLRIALESLFLPEKPQQELKFRLAVSGAWLVGEDPADRQRVWNTLRSAYDLASAAVHQGEIKEKVKGKANSDVLAQALAVCRRGILCLLTQGPVRDWSALVLDSAGDSNDDP